MALLQAAIAQQEQPNMNERQLREDAQRRVMGARFAGRNKPATADFDFPEPNDGIAQPVPPAGIGGEVTDAVELAAFEEIVSEKAGPGAVTKWLGTTGYENTRVQDYREGWLWALNWLKSLASTSPQPARAVAPTAQPTDPQIARIALANGFTLKQQPDGKMALNPYVFDFARALMAPPPAAGDVGEVQP